MTRTRKAFAAAAIAALIAPAAVVAALSSPAVADEDGKHRHSLDTYKREAWVALGGAVDPSTAEISMFCDVGDYALDGMWKVDAHDGDDRTVRAEFSRRNSSNLLKHEWDFKLINAGVGRAQVKTFVTCLDATTAEREDHTHQIVEGTRRDSNAGVATAVGAGATTLTASCGTGEIPVSPSFALLNGATVRLVRSYPTPDLLGWEWVFYGDAGGEAIASIYCIKRNTSSDSGHSHEIDADLLPRPALGGNPGVLETVPVAANGYSDFRISSRPHDEGNVGAFQINHYANIWYLGQDAQGQVRGFRFNNTGGAGTESVKLAVWGFDKRTKKNS